MLGVNVPVKVARSARIAFGMFAGLLVAATVYAQQPPAQPPPAGGGAQQPPAGGGAAAPAPAAGAAAAAPVVRTFGPDGGLVLFFVKPDKTADFEMVMGKLKEALQKSEKPERKQQAATWKLFKSPEPAGPNSLYVFVIDPPVKGADYTVGNILFDAFPAEAQAIYKQFADSLAQGMNLVNLAIVQEFGK
jgi:hypothetical protein